MNTFDYNKNVYVSNHLDQQPKVTTMVMEKGDSYLEIGRSGSNHSGRPRVSGTEHLSEKRRQQMKRAQMIYRRKKKNEFEYNKKRINLLENKLNLIHMDFENLYDECMKVLMDLDSNSRAIECELETKYLIQLFIRYGTRIAHHLKGCHADKHNQSKESESEEELEVESEDEEDGNEDNNSISTNSSTPSSSCSTLNCVQLKNDNEHNNDLAISTRVNIYCERTGCPNTPDVINGTEICMPRYLSDFFINFERKINDSKYSMAHGDNYNIHDDYEFESVNILQIYQPSNRDNITNNEYNNNKSNSNNKSNKNLEIEIFGERNYTPPNLPLLYHGPIIDLIPNLNEAIEGAPHPYWLSNLYAPEFGAKSGRRYSFSQSHGNHSHDTNEYSKSKELHESAEEVINIMSSIYPKRYGNSKLSERLLILSLLAVLKTYLSNDRFVLNLIFPEGFDELYTIPKILFVIKFILKFKNSSELWIDTKLKKPAFYDSNLTQDDELPGYVCAKTIEDMLKQYCNISKSDEELTICLLMEGAICYKWTPLYRKDGVLELINSKKKEYN